MISGKTVICPEVFESGVNFCVCVLFLKSVCLQCDELVTCSAILSLSSGVTMHRFQPIPGTLHRISSDI